MLVPKLPSWLNLTNLTIDDPEHGLDEARNKISNLLMPHDMKVTQQKKPINITLRSAHLSQASITYFNYGVETIIEIDTLRDRYIVEIPLSGVAHTYLGKQHFASRKGLAAIISPGDNFRAQLSDDCTKLLLIIEREAIERELSNMLERTIDTPIRFELGMNLSTKNGRACWHTVQYILKELEQYDASSHLNVYVCKQLEQLLIWSLILNQPNNYSSQLSRGRPSSIPHYIRNAEQYMKEHCGQKITIEDISTAAGVSPRTLFSGFHKYKGISPLKYLTNLRYQCVREVLKSADTFMTVSQIAMEWGFFQLGRFSVEYKKRFGESPSDTIRH